MTTQPLRPPAQELQKSLGFFSLTIFGVGDMLGAGIYSLVGVTAGLLGNMSWAAFLISVIAAMLTGLSYANLGARYPRAAGASFITDRAFKLKFLAYLVGAAVLASGITSMAAASRAFAEYSKAFNGGLPELVTILFFLAILALTVFRGMKESTGFNAVCTAIEAAGLILILLVGARFIGSVDLLDSTSTVHPTGGLTALLLLQGSALTFYAFMGFEDMLNVSEEVKDVQRTFPRAIITALVITSLIYMGVSIVAVSAVPHGVLAESVGKEGALIKVVEVAAPWLNTKVFAVISLFAIANTGLLNYIMASRLIYGMAKQNLLPTFLAGLHKARNTPHRAILCILVTVFLLTFAGKLADLAAATSVLILLVFTVVNAALIKLKLDPAEEKSAFEVPVIVPALAILISISIVLARVFSQDAKAVWIAGILLAGISLSYFIQKGWSDSNPTLPLA